MHIQEIKIRKISFGIAASIVSLMVVVFLYDYNFGLELYTYGVFPRSISGLKGILFSPFIHSTANYSHILNNTLPTFILTWLLFYTYRTVASKVFIIIYLSSGLFVWFLGRESFHIGMSGVIYGLTSFLIVSGFFRKDARVAGISLLVIFLYGSLIWGIFPLDPSVSWEGHFFGFFSGLVLAVVYRNAPPQAQKFKYEIEEEIGFEEFEDDYWLEKPFTSVTDTDSLDNNLPIKINYTFIPNPTNIINPQIVEFEEE